MVDPQETDPSDEHDERPLRDTRELDMQAWRERLVQRPQTDLRVEASVLLQEARSLRDKEIG